MEKSGRNSTYCSKEEGKSDRKRYFESYAKKRKHSDNSINAITQERLNEYDMIGKEEKGICEDQTSK